MGRWLEKSANQRKGLGYRRETGSPQGTQIAGARVRLQGSEHRQREDKLCGLNSGTCQHWEPEETEKGSQGYKGNCLGIQEKIG